VANWFEPRSGGTGFHSRFSPPGTTVEDFFTNGLGDAV